MGCARRAGRGSDTVATSAPIWVSPRWTGVTSAKAAWPSGRVKLAEGTERPPLRASSSATFSGAGAAPRSALRRHDLGRHRRRGRSSASSQCRRTISGLLATRWRARTATWLASVAPRLMSSARRSMKLRSAPSAKRSVCSSPQRVLDQGLLALQPLVAVGQPHQRGERQADGEDAGGGQRRRRRLQGRRRQTCGPRPGPPRIQPDRARPPGSGASAGARTERAGVHHVANTSLTATAAPFSRRVSV